MAITSAELAAAFTAQAKFTHGYSPLYEALFSHAAGVFTKVTQGEPLEFDEQALADLLLQSYTDRHFKEPVLEPTLILAAAIHAAVLSDAPSAAALSRFYATVGGSFEPDYDREVFQQMLGGLYLTPGDEIRAFLREGQIQTNETSRGIAWLLPALVLSAWEGNPPITLIDLGCSAGLNLVADAQKWRWLATDGDRMLNGDPVLIQQRVDFGKAELSVRNALRPGILQLPNIVRRVGFDLNPLNLTDPADLLSLRAAVFGDQASRLDRLDQAIQAYQKFSPAPQLESANILDSSGHLLDYLAPETKLLLVYNTLTTVYLPDREYAAVRRNVEACFRQLPAGVRGIWLELESPRFGEPPTPPKLAALKAHRLEANGELEARYLAYTEPHPQTVMLLNGWEDLRSL